MPLLLHGHIHAFAVEDASSYILTASLNKTQKKRKNIIAALKLRSTVVQIIPNFRGFYFRFT
jgi:hypothetical protein